MRILDRVEKTVYWSLPLFYFFIVFGTFLQVVLRYFIGTSVSWADAASRYSAIWMTMMGAAIAVRRNSHLKIDFFVGKMPEKWKPIIDIVVTLLGICLLLAILFSTPQALHLASRQRIGGLFGIPLSYFFASIPIGATLMLLFSIERIFESIKTINPAVWGRKNR